MAPVPLTLVATVVRVVSHVDSLAHGRLLQERIVERKISGRVRACEVVVVVAAGDVVEVVRVREHVTCTCMHTHESDKPPQTCSGPRRRLCTVEHFVPLCEGCQAVALLDVRHNRIRVLLNTLSLDLVCHADIEHLGGIGRHHIWQRRRESGRVSEGVDPMVWMEDTADRSHTCHVRIGSTQPSPIATPAKLMRAPAEISWWILYPNAGT